MIIATVIFRMPATMTREEAAAVFRGTAPRYLKVPGLVSKHYLHRALPTHVEAGGVYVWESRAAAEAAYGEAWRALALEKYGHEPDVRFFDVPVVVDNTGEGRIAEPPPA